MVPGIILLCAGFGAASTAVYVARDLQTGIIDRFRTMPLRSGAVLTGHVVSSMIRNLLATGIVIGVALLVGFRPTADVWGWVGATGVIALYILAITYLFAAIGLAAGSPEAASGYGFIILFLPYLSSAFVPVDTMPSWLQWVAEHQPITPIIETIRGLLFELPMGAEPWWALGWCVGILAVSVAWGAWLFRRKAGQTLRRQRPGSFFSALSSACLAEAAARPTTSAAWAAESGSVEAPASSASASASSRNGISQSSTSSRGADDRL